jgi:hypothetical protein
MNLGLVQIGSGGNASAYSFDSVTGLSKDNRLAFYLQDLTPAQLQTALDNRDPGPDLKALLNEDLTGTGRGWLPCGSGTDCGSAPPDDENKVNWWLVGVIGLVIVLAVKR